MRGSVRRAGARPAGRADSPRGRHKNSTLSSRLQRTPCRRILLTLLGCAGVAALVGLVDPTWLWSARPLGPSVFDSDTGLEDSPEAWVARGNEAATAEAAEIHAAGDHPWHMPPAVMDWVAQCPWPRVGIAVVTRHCPVHEMEYWLDFHLRRGVCHVWLRVQDTPSLRYLLLHPKYRGKVTTRFVGDNPHRKHFGKGGQAEAAGPDGRSDQQKKKAADWFGAGYGKFKFQADWVNEAAYNASDLGIDWMVHIDDDELLYPMLAEETAGTGLLCLDDRPPLQHVPSGKPLDGVKYPEVLRRQKRAELREKERCPENLLPKRAESIPAIFRKITMQYPDIHDVHFINWEILAPPALRHEPHNGALMPKFRYSHNMVLKGARIAYGNGKSTGKVCRGKKPGEHCLKNYGPHYMAFNDPETGFFNHTREARFDISKLDAVVIHFESPTFEAWLAKFSHSSNSTDKVVFGFYKDSIRRMIQMREFWVDRKAPTSNEARSAFIAELEPYPGAEIEEYDRES